MGYNLEKSCDYPNRHPERLILVLEANSKLNFTFFHIFVDSKKYISTITTTILLKKTICHSLSEILGRNLHQKVNLFTGLEN